MRKEEYNRITGEILDSAIAVHREMGPGLLESVYEYCLIEELNCRGIITQEQVAIPLFYKGQILGKDFRIDILVENEIIIEIKSVDFILPVHEAQLLSYLKLTDKWLGILINFNVPILKKGFKRLVNGYI